MKKLNINLDLGKIDKSRIENRTFTTKDGEEVTKKEYKIEAVPLKEPKIIKEGDTWNLVKTHFIVQGQTKEERENKAESVFLGDGLQFEDKGEPNVDEYNQDIPF